MNLSNCRIIRYDIIDSHINEGDIVCRYKRLTGKSLKTIEDIDDSELQAVRKWVKGQVDYLRASKAAWYRRGNAHKVVDWGSYEPRPAWEPAVKGY